ncbi:MAG: ABC transporter ATP-binding protein [Firmicutes bacterium]|nr:ABC transporter ATP-binding protein [Bacillota bacterium]
MVTSPLLQVNDLKKYFTVGKGQVLKAVDGVSFTIEQGETLGLVGESGCGKTTVGRTIIRLYDADGGQVLFNGKDVHKAKKTDNKELTRRMQMIFQDPYASLNPRITVGDSIGEGIIIHGLYKTKAERRERIYELLNMVGLNKEHANRFPHEFSGGQRQRVGIARALALNPDFIICDEAISALDVSIQAQVVNLLMDLQDKLGLTYLFIAHDLRMVRHISDRTAVMYLGMIAELAASEALYTNPQHPYTKALLSAVPVADPEFEQARSRILLAGDVPSPVNPEAGCRFIGRCPLASPLCAEAAPELREVEPGHFVACYHV